MSYGKYSVDLDRLYGCWLWQGNIRKDGYGTTKAGNMAHRHVFTAEGFTIPPGLYLDHLCRRRCCVNPYHLEPVTRSENERRKTWRRRAKVKTCPRGHDMRYEFVITKQGGKICRRCNKISSLEG